MMRRPARFRSPLASLAVLLALRPAAIDALSSRIANAALLSRLRAVQTELLVSVGRIPGTAMPPEWAASGARLGFALEVEFTDESADYEMGKERLLRGDALMGENLMAVEPLNDPSFVSARGTETIRVEPGAYGCTLQGIESGQYALRFFLDFPEGATRNDVELPSERIYFLTSCWLLGDEASLDRARRRRDDVAESLKGIERELEELDRRGGNVFQKALAFRDAVDLIERRGKLAAQLDELERTYPLDAGTVVAGPNDIVFAREGVIAVKRLRGAMGTREQYHWVGTFTFNDFFEDEEE